jgi:hypothetical protein
VPDSVPVSTAVVAAMLQPAEPIQPGRRRLLGWLLVAVLGGGGGAAVVATADPSPPPDRPGTATQPGAGGSPDVGSSAPPVSGFVVWASEPTALTVPAIGVRAPVARVGLAADGTIETPPLDQPALTAWYRDGPTPGEPGGAVILGHVDSRAGPAVFHRLRDLRPGDQIEVTRQDASTVVFVVDTVESVPKSAFPTERVYGDRAQPVLWLITCGGEFDRTRRSYRNNVIVSASFVDFREPS